MRINPWQDQNETRANFYEMLSENFEVIPEFDVSLKLGNTGRDHDFEERYNAPTLYVELATPRSKPALLNPVIPKLFGDSYECNYQDFLKQRDT